MEEEHPLIKDAYQMAKERFGQRKMKEYDELMFHHTLNVYFNVWTYDKNLDVRLAAMLYKLAEENLTNYQEIARHFGARAADIAAETVDNSNRKNEIGEVGYYVEKFNSRSPEALLIGLCALADRVSLLKKPNQELLKQDPFFPARKIEDAKKILEGLDKKRLHTQHGLIIDKMKVEIESFSKLFR